MNCKKILLFLSGYWSSNLEKMLCIRDKKQKKKKDSNAGSAEIFQTNY